jgi:hypothetical protein
LNESFSNAHASASWGIPKASKKGTKNHFCSAGKRLVTPRGYFTNTQYSKEIGINERHGENGMRRHGGRVTCCVTNVVKSLSLAITQYLEILL